MAPGAALAALPSLLLLAAGAGRRAERAGLRAGAVRGRKQIDVAAQP